MHHDTFITYHKNMKQKLLYKTRSDLILYGSIAYMNGKKLFPLCNAKTYKFRSSFKLCIYLFFVFCNFFLKFYVIIAFIYSYKSIMYR